MGTTKSNKEAIAQLVKDMLNESHEDMLKIQNQNAKKWIDKNVPIIHKQIEKILKEHTTHELKTAARFSNGETIYIQKFNL